MATHERPMRSPTRPLRDEPVRPKRRQGSRRRAVIRRFRAQSKEAWRQLIFWALILIASLGAQLALATLRRSDLPHYQFIDGASMVLVVASAIMVVRVVRHKLRCPQCRAPITNPYGGRALESMVCANCGARLGKDSGSRNPRRTQY